MASAPHIYIVFVGWLIRYANNLQQKSRNNQIGIWRNPLIVNDAYLTINIHYIITVRDAMNFYVYK